MKSALTLTFLALGLLPAQPSIAQLPEEQPAIEGFVTRSASPSDFDVNTVRISCGPATYSGWSNQEESFGGCPAEAPRVGTLVTVFGKLEKKQHLVEAAKIVQHPPAVPGEVSGKAIVDAPPIRNAPGFPAGTIMVRADGYWIVLPFKAKITLVGSINSVEDVSANTWIEYKGKMRSDGSVVASTIKLIPNLASRSQEKLRGKVTYDPASAAATSKQSRVNEALVGVDFSRIHPSADRALQDRVTAIGEKLVPEYLKQLPDSDPSKLQFRFQVVESNWGLYPLPLPGGTILIPEKAAERMQNDSQMAALLADSVATVFEEQSRLRFISKALREANWAALAASFVPGPVGLAGSAVGIGLGANESSVTAKEMKQSARVSLTLMHDAGYDISQTPMAWWLIAAGKKPLSETYPPAETVELYRTIVAVWSHPQPPVTPTK